MITRREFLQDGVLATGGLAAGKLLVEVLTPVTSHAAHVDPNDPGLVSSENQISIDRSNRDQRVSHQTQGERGASRSVVIHEWDGIKEHIRDVARRLAKAGYVALAPDLLSRYGGTSSFSTQEAAIADGPEAR
jgi:carboxymethylenebutenolidase